MRKRESARPREEEQLQERENSGVINDVVRALTLKMRRKKEEENTNKTWNEQRRRKDTNKTNGTHLGSS